MRQLLRERLPAATLELLDQASALAEKNKLSIYVVGGFVRDLLLEIENLDIDLVVEGDGLGFARELARKLKAEITPHSRFGTSVLQFSDGSHLDIATSRKETYAEPAALPNVGNGTIQEDLGRRDFSVNSLAIKLEPDGNRPLLDIHSGMSDLKAKKIRALHPESFNDDPTRIFRAIRFEQRLGFFLDPQTAEWMRVSLDKGVMEKLSGHRLYNELEAILCEKCALPCLERLQDLGVLEAIQPGFSLSKTDFEALEKLEQEIQDPGNQKSMGEPDRVAVCLLGALWSQDRETLDRLLTRLDLVGKTGSRLIQDRDHCQDVLDQFARKDYFSPMEVYEIFVPGSTESAYWLLAVSRNEKIRKAVLGFFSNLRKEGQLVLSGDDFIRLGLKPGPLFQKVFRELRRARFEGLVHTREDEERYVRDHFLKSG